nr:protein MICRORCHIDIA 2-like [Ipomoea batatas]
MPPKLNKVPIDVVEIDSSDDEGSRRTNAAGKSSGRDVTTTVKNPRNKPPGFHGAGPVAPPAPNHRQPDSRSFWKAGNYEVASTRAVAIEGELEHARVHPKFLHSNATSHKWAFGAIAELLDNAVDEVVTISYTHLCVLCVHLQKVSWHKGFMIAAITFKLPMLAINNSIEFT